MSDSNKFITTIVTKVTSEFENTYRITTENGLILDIYDIVAPKIGSKFIYRTALNYTDTNYDDDYIIMNGTTFKKNIVSFGGFLGFIPTLEDVEDTTCVSIMYRFSIQ